MVTRTTYTEAMGRVKKKEARSGKKNRVKDERLGEKIRAKEQALGTNTKCTSDNSDKV